MAEIYLHNSNDPAIIDDEHEQRIQNHRWYLDAEGYVRANIQQKGKRTNVKLHRVIANLIGLDSSRGVSFKDGNKLNCRSSNLKQFECKSESDRKYIYDHEYKGKKRYQIELYNEKTKEKEYVGLADTLEEAKIQRDEALREMEKRNGI